VPVLGPRRLHSAIASACVCAVALSGGGVLDLPGEDAVPRDRTHPVVQQAAGERSVR